jgi:hypothetical protein
MPAKQCHLVLSKAGKQWALVQHALVQQWRVVTPLSPLTPTALSALTPTSPLTRPITPLTRPAKQCM